MPSATVVDRRDAQDVQILDDNSLDPSMHYRWVREDGNNIASKKMDGYRFVVEADGVKTMMEQEDRKADGYIRVADTVLMCCTKERYNQRREVIRRRGEARMGAPEASFEAEVSRRPVGGKAAKILRDGDD